MVLAFWMAQYFEPLQKVRKREQCYSRAKVNRNATDEFMLGCICYSLVSMHGCSQHKKEEKVTNSNLKISLQCFVVLKFSVCFQSS